MADEPLWSGFAYLNNERIQANAGRPTFFRVFPVVLGKMHLRLVADKNIPRLFTMHTALDLERFRTRHSVAARDEFEERDEQHYEAFFYVDGVRYVIEALQFDGTMLDLRLVEPDGAVWSARAGYRFGERFPHSDETAMYHHLPWQEYGVSL